MSFCGRVYRFRRCGAPSARTRTRTRRRPALGAVPCNEKILLPLPPPPSSLRSETIRFFLPHSSTNKLPLALLPLAAPYPLVSPRRGLPQPQAPLPSADSTCRNTAKIQHTYNIHLRRTHTPPLLPPHAPCHRQTYVIFPSLAFSVSYALSICLLYLSITSGLSVFFYFVLFLRFSTSCRPFAHFSSFFTPPPEMPFLFASARVLLYILFFPCYYASTGFFCYLPTGSCSRKNMMDAPRRSAAH